MKACLTPLLPLALSAALLTGCEREPERPAPAPAPHTSPAAAEYAALAAAFTEESAPQLRKLVVAAPGFREAVGALLERPDDTRLHTARNAWTLLYQGFNRAWPVLATRTTLAPSLARPLARADIWPILPGYVDAVPGWPESGLVYDVTLTLNTDTLIAQQDMTDPAEVSVGLQVLHLLLFGLPDAPRAPLDVTAVTELLPSHQLPLSELPENRRRAYLDAASAILLEDLTALVQPAHDDVPPRTLAAALMQALADSYLRLARLAALEGATATDGGEFMSSDVREIAMTETRAAVDQWLNADSPQHQALMALLNKLDVHYANALIEQVTAEPQDAAALAQLLSTPPEGLF
ncbi:imelysin [Alcanivorax sp. S71-1-4]|uniref:imelysin family protein n=1 Tax=Alcanivorax sp. S71-1-4 TaxID=1177159 RepID=UPI001357A3AB|nr:imelysin family protein [Alcanivorax sp. S71-1-4]KAF0811160.1 imelysin [Alcanivorax sp. S71-1-4]